MQIAPLKEAIWLCGLANMTVFMWGHRGVGKSSIVHEVALENKLGYCDMRLSQCEASDLRGLPYANEQRKVTEYYSPSDLPQGGMDWDEYLDKLAIPTKLEQFIEKKKLGEMLEENPAIALDPRLAAMALKRAGEFVAATELQREAVRYQPMLNEGILFLDELNRAQDDVLQAAFQLVHDRAIGEYVLPAGWRIVCAGNYNEGSYNTNGFTDAAFLDRFCHLNFDHGETTQEEWVDYMATRYGQKSLQVIEFTGQNHAFLDGQVKGERGFSVQPSRRSWEKIVQVQEAFDTWNDNITKSDMSAEEKKMKRLSKTALIAVFTGLVGQECAVGFSKALCPIKPTDLIRDGVDKHAREIGKLKRPQLQGLMWGLVSYLKGKLDDDKKAAVARDFPLLVASKSSTDRDIATTFCNLMVGGANMKTRAAIVSNPSVAHLIGKFSRKTKRTFADILNENSKLQKLMSDSAWGQDSADEDDDE